MGIWQRIGEWFASFRAATPNNPTFNMNDPAAWDEYFGGVFTDSSGVKVTREVALSNAAWWRGVNLIARDVGKLPLFIYKRAGDNKERSPDHAAYSLLRYKPNPWQTALQFRMQLTAHAIEEGNGYGYIVRSGGAKPEEILPLDPALTWPLKVNGQLWYATRVDMGGGQFEDRKVPATDILHIKGLGYDGLTGYPCRQMARDEIGLAVAQRRYQSAFFKNDATPGILFEAPGPMPVETVRTFLRQWASMHSGLDNKHKAAVATHGMKAAKLGNSARESQLNESRAMEIREIATFLGVPPHKVGDNSRTAYASLEQENLSYLVDCLDFWLCVWEVECADKLLTEAEKESDSHVVEFLRQALVRADLTARANYYRTALGGRPWMLPDEVRSLENMNALGGEAGEYLNPLNMGQGGQDNQEKPPAPAQKQDAPPADAGEEDAISADLQITLRENFAETIHRMVRRIGNDANRAAKDSRGFGAWLDTFAEDHSAVVTEALRLPYQALCDGGMSKCDQAPALWLFGQLHDAYLEASGEVSAADLQERIEFETQQSITAIPVRAVETYCTAPKRVQKQEEEEKMKQPPAQPVIVNVHSVGGVELEAIARKIVDVAAALPKPAVPVVQNTVNVSPTPITAEASPITIEPQFNVAAPNVTVDVAAPQITVEPNITVEAPKPVRTRTELTKDIEGNVTGKIETPLE